MAFITTDAMVMGEEPTFLTSIYGLEFLTPFQNIRKRGGPMSVTQDMLVLVQYYFLAAGEVERVWNHGLDVPLPELKHCVSVIVKSPRESGGTALLRSLLTYYARISSSVARKSRLGP
jgi:hypothetical protein